jgi:tRNA C32,U32 (ribose-2'-O)-methylase TrmJ
MEQPASVEEINRLYAHMESVMSKSEFLPKENPDGLLQVIRTFFHRSRPSSREINILLGVFTNINGFMKKYVKNKKQN